ncbi:MAG: aminopeptidase P family protein [Actinobacteria bacterium]|nr:aminopeptidase P family protein [Actinomycetota bacterium]
MALEPRPESVDGTVLNGAVLNGAFLGGDGPESNGTSRPLAAMDVAGRIGRLRERLATERLDALLVTNLTNIRYLSGFTGSAGLMLISGDDAVLVTDGRYGEQAPAQVERAGAPTRVEINGDKQTELIARLLNEARLSRLGLEADAVTWAAQRRYATAFDGVELVASSGAVEALRLTKDVGELDRMLRAAAIADAAFAEVRPLLGEVLDGRSLTEVEFGFALDTAIRRLGAAGNSFETIVASGPNGALPHARPTDRPLERGDLVVVDFGARVDGYCSDMTRTVAIGTDGDLSEQKLAMVEAVAAAQRAGVEAVGAGVSVKAVDEACRSLLTEAGLAEHFTHGTGHGVGLDIHEAPRVSKLADATLSPGFVVTVEPGVYIAPHGGVRIEDTVVVTETGCWSLTAAPKTLYAA